MSLNWATSILPSSCLWEESVTKLHDTDIITIVKLIGWKDKDKTLLVDPDEINCLKTVGELYEEADSIWVLYKRPNPAHEAGSVWKDIVLSPSRLNIQKELKYAIQKIEKDNTIAGSVQFQTASDACLKWWKLNKLLDYQQVFVTREHLFAL